MADLYGDIMKIPVGGDIEKVEMTAAIPSAIDKNDYTIVDQNDTKPWGAYFRIDGAQADDFVREFFPGLSLEEARLGNPDAELSPKILLVSPGQRLSWQYHDRRAERWVFLNDGGYYKSTTDDEGDLKPAKAGDVVQFERGERHRLAGRASTYTLVAEIWQHTDSRQLSDEDDIVRLQDDYRR